MKCQPWAVLGPKRMPSAHVSTAGLKALNNRGQWPDGWQTAGLKALNNRGQWPDGWQNPNNRGRWPDGWQTAGLKARNNRGQWPECRIEAAAEGFRGFRHLRAGKRQA